MMLVFFTYCTGKTKVAYFDDSSFGDEYIFGFHVSVNHLERGREEAEV